MSFRANILLNEFGVRHNIDSMQFDADGICSFLIDEKFDITMAVDNDEKIYIYGLICKADIDEAYKYSLVMLSTNMYLYSNYEIACCYDHHNTSFVLLKSVDINLADNSTLSDSVKKIIDSIETLEVSLKEMGYIAPPIL